MMQNRLNPPLRVLVGCVFRLAVRAFAASQRRLVPIEIFVAPSHELVRRIEAGEVADVLLLGDLDLARRVAPPDSPARVFATDRLMIAARPEIGVNDRNLLERLLDDRVRVVVAAPGRHATGDMTWRMFDRAELLVPGAAARLRAKVRTTLIPSDNASAVWGPRRAMDVLSSGDADLVIASRSVLRTLSAVADLVTPPPALAEELTCSLVVLPIDPDHSAAARAFTEALTAPAGRALLQRHGFDAAPDPG